MICKIFPESDDGRNELTEYVEQLGQGSVEDGDKKRKAVATGAFSGQYKHLIGKQ